MPSSAITVESTSKQTASALARDSNAPVTSLPSNVSDFSLNEESISAPLGIEAAEKERDERHGIFDIE